MSLAALGLGFQQQRYALFALAATTALGFWYLDVLMKGYQMRYYVRMRDIEVAAYRLNAVQIEGLGLVSAPRIDMTWGFTGKGRDWRMDAPVQRDAIEFSRLLRLRYGFPQVLLPHAVAVVLGTGLFVAALLEAPGLEGLAL